MTRAQKVGLALYNAASEINGNTTEIPSIFDLNNDDRIYWTMLGLIAIAAVKKEYQVTPL